jgi:hypothetical protein
VREDPIFSGGWVKAALVILVAGALGVGAYLLVSGVDINLPDLPDVGTNSAETNLSNTTLEDTTIGRTQTEPQPQPATTANPFTSAAFGSAIAKVRAAVGPNRQLTRVSINDTQTQFSVRRGNGIEAYSVRADSGDLVRQRATITISGNATIADFAFALDGLKPSAVDRMLASARKMSGAADFKPTVLNLERRIPFGSRELAWTINAEGSGRNLTYRAAADGGQVQSIGGGGTPIPPQVQQAQQLNQCIQAASGDIDEITACFDRFNNRTP